METGRVLAAAIWGSIERAAVSASVTVPGIFAEGLKIDPAKLIRKPQKPTSPANNEVQEDYGMGLKPSTLYQEIKKVKVPGLDLKHLRAQ